MPDEKKDHDLDADILQSKADILEALRAAGKPTSNKPDTSSEQPSEVLSEEDSLSEADIIDLADDESEHAEIEDITADELISDFPEEELLEESAVQIVSLEESQQSNDSSDNSSSESIESPAVPEVSASSEEPVLNIEQLRRDNRQLNDRHPPFWKKIRG